MSKFTAFTTLQKQGGEDLANAIADFVEAQDVESNKVLATREDAIRLESKLTEQILKSEAKLLEQLARLEKEIANRYNILVAVLTALGVILTLLNKFL